MEWPGAPFLNQRLPRWDRVVIPSQDQGRTAGHLKGGPSYLRRSGHTWLLWPGRVWGGGLGPSTGPVSGLTGWGLPSAHVASFMLWGTCLEGISLRHRTLAMSLALPTLHLNLFLLCFALPRICFSWSLPTRVAVHSVSNLVSSTTKVHACAPWLLVCGPPTAHSPAVQSPPCEHHETGGLVSVFLGVRGAAVLGFELRVSHFLGRPSANPALLLKTTCKSMMPVQKMF
jgi:hypothetical protein